MTSCPVLRVGDQVHFEDSCWTVAGLDGTRVRLADMAGRAQLLLAAHLVASPGFRLLNTGDVASTAGHDRPTRPTELTRSAAMTVRSPGET